MESSINEKDVAIVHVSLNDMPSVQLGDSTNVQQQDELTIIGFPGNGDVSNKPTDLLTSSINKISVSSIKTTDSGAEVIQVGGNVEHGDSGGPALDAGAQGLERPHVQLHHRPEGEGRGALLLCVMARALCSAEPRG